MRWRFILYALLEPLGYRQLNWYWRLEAMLRYPFGKSRWIVTARQQP